MKAIKDILSGKGLPKRGEKGFTLVELLIVLAILAVLAAVVIPNVTGMFGRGAKQAFSTDMKTIQTGVASFYFDVHKYDGTNGWNDTTALAGHRYAVAGGAVIAGWSIDTDPALPAATGFTENTFAVQLLGVDQTDVDAVTIWMGLLVNIPSDAVVVEGAGTSTPVDGETGPYLNEFPQSCTIDNGNPATTTGTYTWIVLANGQVVGCAVAPLATNNNYYAGFNGTYP